MNSQLETLKQSGIGGNVGIQILRFLKAAGVRVTELTNAECYEIENLGKL